MTAEVVFPGPDAATGTMGAPFGAGFNPIVTHSPDHLLAGARAYNRWAARAVPGEPGAARRADRRADPRRPRRRDRRDPPCARRRPHRRRDHPAALGRARVVHELPLRPGVGGVRGARAPGALPLGSRAARGLRRGQRLDERLRLRDDLLHRAPAVVHAAHRRVRAVPRAQDGGHRSRVLLGRRPAVARRHDGDARARHAQDGEHPRHPHDAAERVLRPQRQDRRVEHAVGASSAGATRSASTTSCGATTSRTPRARGPTRASS